MAWGLLCCVPSAELPSLSGLHVCKGRLRTSVRNLEPRRKDAACLLNAVAEQGPAGPQGGLVLQGPWQTCGRTVVSANSCARSLSTVCAAFTLGQAEGQGPR